MGIKAHLVMGQSVVVQSFFEGIGGASVADGLMVPIQLGSFGPEAGGKEMADLYAELQKGLGRLPAYFNTFGYDVGLITEAGVNKSNGTRQGIRDALEEVNGGKAAGDDAKARSPANLTDNEIFNGGNVHVRQPD